MSIKQQRNIFYQYQPSPLTHWGRITHICVGKLTIIGSYNGLSPGRRQAIIWTNAGILLIGPLRTNFSEILIEIHTFSFKKIDLKMSSGKWRPSCLGPNPYTGNAWIHSQHCGYRSPGANAPGHHYTQWWWHIGRIGPVLYKHVTFTANDGTSKWNYMLKKKMIQLFGD